VNQATYVRLPGALDHVGIAAHGPTAPLVSMLADGPLSPRDMPSGVTVARFGPGEMLELVWPRTDTSPVGGFLARRGPGLHHVALAVDVPLRELTGDLAARNVRLTGPIEESSDGRPSVFVHPASTGGVLIELVEGRR
jgi:methylmalonyl-CoA/ethylmalonyl-CoA epimerase